MMSPDGTPRGGVVKGTPNHMPDGAIAMGKPVDGDTFDHQAAKAETVGPGPGDALPFGQAQELETFLKPYQETCSQYVTRIRPWREFAVLSKPTGLRDVRPRLEANLVHYRTNYGLGFLVLFVIGIVQNTWCIVVVCVLAAIWAAYLKKDVGNDEALTVGGYALDRPRRRMVLAALSAVVFVISTGQVLFQAALVCAALVTAHGALHPVPEALQAVPAEDVEAGNPTPTVVGAPTFGGAPACDEASY